MSSHYKISSSKKGNYYFFKTKNSITYNCFFTQSTSSNDILGLPIANPVYNFIIRRKTKIASNSVTFDPMIGSTISELLNLFFFKNPSAIIGYICDNIDNKASKRQISFNQWLVKHNNKEPKKAMIRVDIQNIFHAGAILLDQNPDKRIIEAYFKEQLEEYRNSEKIASVEIIQ